ncbi:hypothetical protein [Streptomyces spectabilis]|uniref:Uncharacterized protein n=1 Tax=Streptomyces spectabilis TaxID=68270 RepID=A0A5P2X2G9_STRST|nr:hypothetical protein [Streptomyces spectabilis]MBB5108339.1 hypothetical protein [Streptomyces spectabilis]MCI3901096.1 hypothetical protein [Streptomyces spectabilis]QEV58588.1 hypothetical protein CP982_07555 [Streptomyces spectabilis]GGV45944.1 hypothetical protein GCM10010245_72010 [Streptomyces spectabilis]
MGLFGRRKFSEMPTAEERYFAAQKPSERRVPAQPDEAELAFRERSARRRERERAAAEERRKQVVSAGTIRRRGRTVILEGDWKLATDKLPLGDLSGLTARGRLGDLTVSDLHALATNHGPDCNCGRFR